jgi:hypothetical protein
MMNQYQKTARLSDQPIVSSEIKELLNVATVLLTFQATCSRSEWLRDRVDADDEPVPKDRSLV